MSSSSVSLPSPPSPILTAPLLPTILRLAWPGVLLVGLQTAVSVMEMHAVGRLGTAPLAGLALVFPFVMLLQMMSAGAIGGSISSAIARALGAGNPARAQALLFHAFVLALLIGCGFSVLMVIAGPWLFGLLGGRDAVLQAASHYAMILFGACLFTWLANFCASMLRGQGAMGAPALMLGAAACVHIPLTYALTLGAWGAPALGIRGAALAYVLAAAFACALHLSWLMRGPVRVRLSFRGQMWDRALAWDIVRVGGLASMAAVQTVLTALVLTGAVTYFGVQSLAGFGIGVRLELLQVPLVFAIGAALVPIVGINIGAGQTQRAKRAAFVGAGVAGCVCGVIGLVAALWPQLWTGLFTQDPLVAAIGADYLRRVAPFYPAMGVAVALYFASQGAQQVGWPVLAGTVRLAIAAGGSALVVATGGTAVGVFWAVALAIVAWGAVTAWAVWRARW